MEMELLKTVITTFFKMNKQLLTTVKIQEVSLIENYKKPAVFNFKTEIISLECLKTEDLRVMVKFITKIR